MRCDKLERMRMYTQVPFQIRSLQVFIRHWSSRSFPAHTNIFHFQTETLGSELNYLPIRVLNIWRDYGRNW
jgi:hypothetical protein